MDQNEFELGIRKALGAGPNNGFKWRPFEKTFGDEGLRAGGAINNQAAERRTRARQVFTAKKHPGFVTDGHAAYGVYVINQDAATRQMKEEQAPPEVPYLDRAVADLQAEYGGETMAVLILRFEPEVSADGQRKTEQRDGKETAVGTLKPLKLILWEEDEVTAQWQEWYDAPEVRPSAGLAAKLRLGDVPLPSESGESPLMGVDAAFERSVAALRAGQHLVLYGPPGTGKSELAELLCVSLIEDPPEHYSLTTATSDWTTFDTIGGYMPQPTTDGSTFLDFHPGAVTSALEQGRWLIIDELNRADVDKAFGELFTLLTKRPVKLPYKKRSGEEWRPVVLGDAGGEDVHAIPVSPDWRLIGTLNTFDKASLYQLSYAFMRRFAFVYVAPPDTTAYRELITDRASGEFADESEAVCAQFADLVGDVFAAGEGEGLAGAGIEIGPAIALDVLRYSRGRLAERDGTLTDEELPEVAQRLVLEGLEALLYPQLEGRDREHEDILANIAKALDLGDETKAATGTILSIWTGFDGPT